MNVFKKILFIFLIITFSILIEGCTDDYYETETFVLDQDYYYGYQFVLQEGDYIDFSVKTQGGPVDVIFIDSNNFYKYSDETSTSEYYEYDELYENVISKDIQFIVPSDGEWYVILENNEDYDITIEVEYESY